MHVHKAMLTEKCMLLEAEQVCKVRKM